MAAVGAEQAQEAVRQDAAFEERIELVFDELRQASASSLHNWSMSRVISARSRCSSSAEVWHARLISGAASRLPRGRALASTIMLRLV